MKVLSALRSFNMFAEQHTANNSTKIYKQLLSTRIFMLSFITALCIIVVYASLNPQTYKTTARNPSLSSFEYIRSTHSDTMYCPCSNISFSYGEFITTSITLHPICSSYFVSEEWIKIIAMSQSSDDFSLWSTSFFRLLNLFCWEANESVNKALLRFHSTRYIISEPLSRLEFGAVVESLVLHFQTSVPVSFIRTLQLVRDTTHGNGLYNAYVMGWELHDRSMGQYEGVISRSVQFNGCSCATKKNCTRQTELTNYANSRNYTTRIIDGIMTSCSPLESFIHSSLECLYNNDCLDFLFIVATGTMNSSENVPLDPNSLRNPHFSPQTKLESILNVLMIETITNTSSYEKFYEMCSPSMCTYTYTANGDAIYIITVTIAQYGGLKVALNFLVPLFVKGVWNLKEKFLHRRRITPLN